MNYPRRALAKQRPARDQQMSLVAVVGLGYVGLPLATRAAEVGHTVVGLDSDPSKIAALRSGSSHVEDISDERLGAVLRDGRLHLVQATPTQGDPARYARGFERFDVGVITVPTPLEDGKPDLSYVEGAARTLGRHLRPGGLVVLESTSYPGTTEGLVADVLQEESGLQAGIDYHLGFSPERIDPGNERYSFETTPKLVSGTDAAALAEVQAFYRGLVETTVPVSSPAVAECAKLFENIFRQVNVALVNEMATLAHELDIDFWQVLDAAGSKPYGFMKFTPGPGVGGHCIPVDPGYFSWFTQQRLGRASRFIDLAREINEAMPAYVVERAGELLGPGGLARAGVLVLGISYKKGTADLRKAPGLDIVDLLLEAGAAVTVSDPYLKDWTATPLLDVADIAGCVGDFDLVIVVTDHDELDFDAVGRTARLVLDCRRRIPANESVHLL